MNIAKFSPFFLKDTGRFSQIIKQVPKFSLLKILWHFSPIFNLIFEYKWKILKFKLYKFSNYFKNPTRTTKASLLKLKLFRKIQNLTRFLCIYTFQFLRPFLIFFLTFDFLIDMNFIYNLIHFGILIDSDNA